MFQPRSACAHPLCPVLSRLQFLRRCRRFVSQPARASVLLAESCWLCSWAKEALIWNLNWMQQRQREKYWYFQTFQVLQSLAFCRRDANLLTEPRVCQFEVHHAEEVLGRS